MYEQENILCNQRIYKGKNRTTKIKIQLHKMYDTMKNNNKHENKSNIQ